MSADSDWAMRSTVASSVSAGFAAGISCAREGEAMVTLFTTIRVIHDGKRIRNLYGSKKGTSDFIGRGLPVPAREVRLAMPEYASACSLGNRRDRGSA